jgi:Uma2 family endonuclease
MFGASRRRGLPRGGAGGREGEARPNPFRDRGPASACARPALHSASMVNPIQRRATYADLLDVPENMLGEIIDGELLTQPRPAAPQARAASRLGMDLGAPFDRGKGGPGGWIILYGPELHLNGDALVPDLAGWRRERMGELPQVAAFELAPDWVCEVLSPSTQSHDRVKKMRAYARERVSHVWLVDPRRRRWKCMHGRTAHGCAARLLRELRRSAPRRSGSWSWSWLRCGSDSPSRKEPHGRRDLPHEAPMPVRVLVEDRTFRRCGSTRASESATSGSSIRGADGGSVCMGGRRVAAQPDSSGTGPNLICLARRRSQRSGVSMPPKHSTVRAAGAPAGDARAVRLRAHDRTRRGAEHTRPSANPRSRHCPFRPRRPGAAARR